MPSVLVLGAGINGTALARELVLLGLDVILCDTADLASGTTAYSSRLIHGGLRYLEYGDTALVRESLAERERLLRLAPDFVRPLEFRVPTVSRIGGAFGSTWKLLFGKAPPGTPPRGEWLIRFGLWWYTRLAGTDTMPRPRKLPTNEMRSIGLASDYRGVVAYYDAQIRFPERFVVAMADDARQAAAKQGRLFRVHTYANIARRNETIVVTDELMRETAAEYRPDVVVNAGGPWVDTVLRSLGAADSRFIAGTKGSHIVTYHAGLRRAIGEAALYVEADDGRPVFILPFGDGTLIGTTDLPFQGDPATAVADSTEIEYLLALVQRVLPGVHLSRADVTMHYSGVRPLPRSDASTPAAISRRHAVVEQPGLPWPVFSLVGGKLTTCRQLAEEAAAVVARKLGIAPQNVSRDRPVPELQVSQSDDGVARPHIAETTLLRTHVRQVIRGEFVRRLDDLIERRLMLHFAPRLHRATLVDLAELLVEADLLEAHRTEEEVNRVAERLRTHFGRAVE